MTEGRGVSGHKFIEISSCKIVHFAQYQPMRILFLPPSDGMGSDTGSKTATGDLADGPRLHNGLQRRRLVPGSEALVRQKGTRADGSVLSCETRRVSLPHSPWPPRGLSRHLGCAQSQWHPSEDLLPT